MAAKTSTASGNVSAPATWTGGVVPVEGDTVTISHTVTLDQDWTVGADTTTNAINVASGGTFKVDIGNNTARTLILKGPSSVASGGKWEFGTAASPVPAAKVVTIKANYSAALAASKYDFNVASGGVIEMVGAQKTNRTTLTAQAASAQAVLTLADTTGWVIGDLVLVGTTDAYNATSHNERMTVLTVDSATQVTLTGNLTYTHASGARVINMTRNVKLTSFSASAFWEGSWAGTGPHTLQDVEFSNIGGGNVGINLGTSTSPTFTRCSFYDSTAGANGITTSFSLLAATDCTFVSFGIRTTNSSRSLAFTRCSFAGSTFSSNGGINHGSSHSVTHDTCDFFGLATGWQATALANYSGTNNTIYACNIGVSFGLSFTTAMTESGSVWGVGPGGSQTNGAGGDIFITSAALVQWTLDNCTTTYSGGSVTSPSNLLLGSKISFGRRGGVSTDNITYVTAGTITQQSSVVYDSTYAVGAAFTSAANPLDIDLTVIGSSGSPLAVTGVIRKNATYGSGTALPTVTLSGLGMTTSTYTMTDVNDTWVQFTVSGIPTRSGVADLKIRGQVAAGIMYVDKLIVAGVAINTGDFDLFHLGYPITTIISTGLGALDVWSVPTSSLTATGSIGKLASKLLTVAKFLGLQ